MKILLIDNGTSLMDKLEALIPGSTVEKAQKISDVDDGVFDLTVLSGSRRESVVWNHADFIEEMKFITKSTKPVIGICFGCELMAYAFGSTLKELNPAHKGIRKIEIIDTTFSDQSSVSVYESHRWIIDKLSDQFKVLAKSPEGPEIIQHVSRPLFGLQFHPENMVDQTDGDEIFNNVIQRLTKSQP